MGYLFEGKKSLPRNRDNQTEGLEEFPVVLKKWVTNISENPHFGVFGDYASSEFICYGNSIANNWGSVWNYPKRSTKTIKKHNNSNFANICQKIALDRRFCSGRSHMKTSLSCWSVLLRSRFELSSVPLRSHSLALRWQAQPTRAPFMPSINRLMQFRIVSRWIWILPGKFHSILSRRARTYLYR